MKREAIIQSVRTLAIAGLVIFSFGAAGEICGNFKDTTAGAFGPNYPDNSVEDLDAVLARLGRPAELSTSPDNALQAPLAISVVEDNDGQALVAWDLNKQTELWRVSTPVSSELIRGGNSVVFLSDRSVLAHRVDNGQLAWSYKVPSGWQYHGATVDSASNLAVISLGTSAVGKKVSASGQIVALNADSGDTRWERETASGLLGRPATAHGLIFVPWERQALTVLDGQDGQELLRLRAGDFTLDHVSADSTGVYYGSAATPSSQAALFRLDPQSVSGLRAESTRFEPVLEPVPGNPAFMRDAFANPIAGRSSAEKIRFHIRPELSQGSETISYANNSYYLHYWRYIVAFDARLNLVQWAYRSADDIEAVQVIDGGILGVSSEGRLFFLDQETGGETFRLDTEQQVLAAIFDARGFEAPKTDAAKIDPLESLKEMIADKDNRMLPIRAYTAFIMAALPEPEITRDLLEVYSSSDIPDVLRETVVAALKKRTAGSEYLVNALRWRFDYLEQTQTPPMNVVADTLVGMKDNTAVPGLLWHLMNHETHVEHLYDIARAVGELGDASALGSLQQFLALYHADSALAGHEAALQEVAAGIVKFDRRGGKKFVQSIRNDNQTLKALVPLLDDVLEGQQASDQGVDESDEQDLAAILSAAAAAEAEAARSRRQLSREEIREVFAQNSSLFNRCIKTALVQKPTLQSLRLNMAIRGADGLVSQFTILPDKLPGVADCFAKTFKKVPFPRFNNLSQNASHTVVIENLSVPVTQQTDGEPRKVYDPDAFDGIALPDQPTEKTDDFDPDAFK